MNNMKNRIRIAIQKSGRLSEESLRLLACSGIIIKPRKEQLFCHSENFPLDLLLVRDDDIPNLVSDGTCDYGIVGTNIIEEQMCIQNRDILDNNNIVRYLGFAYCRLAIAVPKGFDYQNLNSLSQMRIATSYPNLLSRYFEKNNTTVDVIQLSGSVEIAPRLGIADAICDLVSTGATLEANNLEEVETIFESQAVLIKTPKPFLKDKQMTCELFQNRIEGSELAHGSKYIMLHVPRSALAEVVTLLPGVERPTILELEGDQTKVAVHALCRENIFWETMENLKKAGASSILVLPVEKMMM